MISLVVLAMCVSTAAVKAQLQLSAITAIVTDDRGRAVPDALVSLTDPLGAELQQQRTNPAGHALFQGVAPGRYELRTSAAGTAPFQVPITVVGALPLEVTVRVPTGLTDHVIVESQASNEPSSRASVAGESLARVPLRLRARGLQDVVATLPGWATEDNGLLHARGVDDGFLYVIDGVPVYERLDAVSGVTPDLSGVASVTVITGYVPPEFGHKAGGVIDVRSAAEPGRSLTADVSLGSDAARETAIAAGGTIGASIGLRAGVAASLSDRFLDPVHPDNFHNDGRQANTFGALDWSAATDRVSTGWGYGGSTFDVPNNEIQEAKGQDQRQRVRQGYVSATWQRTWSSQMVTQVAGYHRRTNARLDGSPLAVPIEAHADRSLVRTGVLFSATRQAGDHLLKGGFEWQRLTLDEEFAFETRGLGIGGDDFDGDGPLSFQFSGRASPVLWSAYVQDSWTAASRLTVSGGVRFDRSTLLLTRTQWSPRAGAAFRVSDATTLRGAVSRFFQPPQPENLLLSSSPEARVLSELSVGVHQGGADLEPERQWGTEIGIEQRIAPRLRLDIAYWRRAIRHASDPNVFGGTTIIFPNSVAKGRAHGFEARLEMPQRRGWSAYANWSIGRVVQTGPITGGLFLEDEVEELGPGVEFAPDHDQRYAAGGAVTWQHASTGLAVSGTARYESGTPVPITDEDDLEELLGSPGAEMVDVTAGRVKPRTILSLQAAAPVFRNAGVTLTAGIQVVNLLDVRYAYNFGNPFSGTHFGAPRTLAITLRVIFR